MNELAIRIVSGVVIALILYAIGINRGSSKTVYVEGVKAKGNGRQLLF